MTSSRDSIPTIVGGLIGVLLMIAVGVLVVMAIADTDPIPAVLRTITRHRLIGTWHIEGSIADWRFNSDGSWMEDGLVDTYGSFQMLAEDRIRIKGDLGTTLDFHCTFDEDGLLLEGENTLYKLRLKRKE